MLKVLKKDEENKKTCDCLKFSKHFTMKLEQKDCH